MTDFNTLWILEQWYLTSLHQLDMVLRIVLETEGVERFSKVRIHGIIPMASLSKQAGCLHGRLFS